MYTKIGAPTLALAFAAVAGLSSCAQAAGPFDHSVASVGHSAAAVSHGVAAVGTTAVTAVAVPMVVIGEAARVAGESVGGTGTRLIEKARQPLVIETDKVIINPSPDGAPSLD